MTRSGLPAPPPRAAQPKEERARGPRTSGSRGGVLMGHLPAFSRDPLGFLVDAARGLDPVVHFRFGRTRACLLTDAALIEEVLVGQRHHFVKSAALRAQRDLLGNGLLTNEGESWLAQRRLAQPAFHRERIAAYGAAMVAHTEHVLAGWAEGDARGVQAEMKRLTAGVTARTLFDAEIASEIEELGAAIEATMARYAGRRGLARLLPHWLPTAAHRSSRAGVRRFDALVRDLVRQRRATGEDRGDLLSMLLHARDEAGRGMSDRQLRDELVTLFVGGFDTPSLALSWAWYLLACHPGAEARLAAEVSDALGGRAPRAADLPSLRYVEAVVKEAMRLYPPAWLLSREATADVEIGGYTLRSGTLVLMSPWVMHRHPHRFDAPDVFRPERWLDGSLDGLPRCAYFPFGAGPRVCIGASFAMMESVLVLTTIAQRFRFTLDSTAPLTPWPTMTLRPHGEMMATLRQRTP